jgi:hypothetical protein
VAGVGFTGESQWRNGFSLLTSLISLVTWPFDWSGTVDSVANYEENVRKEEVTRYATIATS